MKEQYIDELRSAMESMDWDGVYIYPDGHNDEMVMVVVDSHKAKDELNERLKKRLQGKTDEIEREYDDFWLDLASGDNWEFSDSVRVCTNCGRAYRIEQYSEFHIGDGFQVCSVCVKEDPSYYIDDLINNPERANTILDRAELAQLGFEQVNDIQYENGLYEGQNDDPREIMEKAQKEEAGEYIFNIVKDYNPYQVVWELWKRKETKTNE